jgi:hypothetical protein
MSEKKQYWVQVPVTMSIGISVDAESPEAAKAAVFEADFGFKVIGKAAKRAEINEWQMHEEIVTGNVFHGVINRMSVEESG